MVIRVGIVGGTGYTGLELLRILEKHPGTRVEWVTSEHYAGTMRDEYCPAWNKRESVCFEAQDLEGLASRVDVVFLALPHGVSMEWVPKILDRTKVIDLGADFRIKNSVVYQACYGLEHLSPLCVKEAVYGIPEVYRFQIRNARLIANPGCYPTSILIPLIPLLKENLIESRIIADSKSGVSGAGKMATENTHFCEVDGNFKTYNLGKHRHQPEIREQLSFFSKNSVDLIFTPHLLPLKRGILSTIYVDLQEGVREIDLREVWKSYYDPEPWVRVFPPNRFPEIKWVTGSNFVDIGLAVLEPRHLVIVSALDNLTRGASGQAIQNMNIMFGLDERLGLPVSVLYP